MKIMWPETPTTVELAGTLRRTTDPAPMRGYLFVKVLTRREAKLIAELGYPQMAGKLEAVRRYFPPASDSRPDRKCSWMAFSTGHRDVGRASKASAAARM